MCTTLYRLYIYLCLGLFDLIPSWNFQPPHTQCECEWIYLYKWMLNKDRKGKFIINKTSNKNLYRWCVPFCSGFINWGCFILLYICGWYDWKQTVNDIPWVSFVIFYVSLGGWIYLPSKCNTWWAMRRCIVAK